MDIVLEVGLNHFGKISFSKRYLNFFLKSNYQYITYQIQKDKFYEKNKFKLPLEHYSYLIDQVHKNKKKIGLAVTEKNNISHLLNLNFDFFKVLSKSIKDEDLLKFVLKKQKPVYLSCGLINNREVKKIIKKFYNYRHNIYIIHTSFSYNPVDQNLQRMLNFKKISKNVCYGLHYKNYLPILLSSSFEPKKIFVYIKLNSKDTKRYYPDNDHAIFINDLNKLNDTFIECNTILGNTKDINFKVKDFVKKKIRL